MPAENVIQVFVVPEYENVAKSVDLFETNMAAEVDGINQFSDEHLVNVVDINSPDDTQNQNVITETLYTDSYLPDGKDFITLNAADVSYISSSLETPTMDLDVGNVSSVESPLHSSVLSPVSQESNMNEDDHVSNTVSPAEVLAAPKKKRGRKPKSEAGLHPPAKKEKKVKAYENAKPYDNKVLERKRLNAINAKRHRDMQKQERETLKQQLDEVISERDKLKKEVEELQKRELLLSQQVDMFKQRAKSLMSVFDNHQ